MLVRGNPKMESCIASKKHTSMYIFCSYTSTQISQKTKMVYLFFLIFVIELKSDLGLVHDVHVYFIHCIFKNLFILWQKTQFEFNYAYCVQLTPL